LRIEVGPKDVAKGTVALARRDIPGKDGKSFLLQTGLAGQVKEMLQSIQKSMLDRALAFREEHTYEPRNYGEFQEAVQNGWAFAWWCDDRNCEGKIKEETKATARCIPFEQPEGQGRCIYCQRPATTKVIFARAY
jgi:prolyl-tRNA synthetase